MKRIYYLTMALGLIACSESQINNGLNQVNKAMKGDALSTEEVAQGLKEALVNGTNKGSDQASKTDGYFKNQLIKILFPPEIAKVESRLRSMGLNKPVDDFVMSMNRAAEDAAVEAKPIFVSAIKAMTVQDAWGILKGEKNAATAYLKKTTSSQLYSKFNPKIKASLQKVNATKYFSDVINTYNAIPMVEKVNPNLDSYVTNKAMDGLFLLIEKEEKNIRENPGARTTDLLKKVFAQQS